MSATKTASVWSTASLYWTTDGGQRVAATHLSTVWEGDYGDPAEPLRIIAEELGVDLLFGRMQRSGGQIVSVAYLADTEQLLEAASGSV